jgi:hypothetical protein
MKGVKNVAGFAEACAEPGCKGHCGMGRPAVEEAVTGNPVAGYVPWLFAPFTAGQQSISATAATAPAGALMRPDAGPSSPVLARSWGRLCGLAHPGFVPLSAGSP